MKRIAPSVLSADFKTFSLVIFIIKGASIIIGASMNSSVGNPEDEPGCGADHNQEQQQKHGVPALMGHIAHDAPSISFTSASAPSE